MVFTVFFFSESESTTASTGATLYRHGDTTDALHTADFQASRPPEGGVQPSTLQVSFGETNFVSEKET